jgi:predicted AlkP superfamily pyrophosphatase or phosphodiesterase
VNRPRRITIACGIVLGIGLLATSFAARSRGEESPSASPLPGVRGVLLVSVDGLRPDLIKGADTPVLHRLMARGSFSLLALTTAVAVTLPSHVSMLTGVPPEVHGVTWNGDPPPGKLYPLRPTLFGIAHAAGYRTAMAAGKSKFVALQMPGTLDRSFVPEASAIGDNAVADTAVSWIRDGAPQLLFVHLPGVDVAGHTFGWGSPPQLAAIAKADRNIGRILDALRSAGVLDSTVVLITADHGGSGRTHGADVPKSLQIPWIIAGPGIRHRLDLDAEGVVVHTEDSFATLALVLGLSRPQEIAGRAVDAALSTTVAESHRTSESHGH